MKVSDRRFFEMKGMPQGRYTKEFRETGNGREDIVTGDKQTTTYSIGAHVLVRQSSVTLLQIRS